MLLYSMFRCLQVAKKQNKKNNKKQLLLKSFFIENQNFFLVFCFFFTFIFVLHRQLGKKTVKGNLVAQ